MDPGSFSRARLPEWCYSVATMDGIWDYPEWQPVPLELPVDDPNRSRPVVPIDGDAEDDDERPGRVIEIDLT